MSISAADQTILLIVITAIISIFVGYVFGFFAGYKFFEIVELEPRLIIANAKSYWKGVIDGTKDAIEWPRRIWSIRDMGDD